MPEEEPDEIIGDFRRGKEIGKGSFAAVYLAQHRVCSTAMSCATIVMMELATELICHTEEEVIRSCQGSADA